VAAGVTLAAAAALACGVNSRDRLHAAAAAATTATAGSPRAPGVPPSPNHHQQPLNHQRNHGNTTGAEGEPGGPLVFHAATSTVSPCLHWEAYMLVHRFFSAHTPPFRLGRWAGHVTVA
jgi:hypothetical protein